MSLNLSQFLLTQMKRGHSLEDTRTLDLIGGEMLSLITGGWVSFSSFLLISNQMSSPARHVMGGKPVMGCLCWLGGLWLMSCLPEEPLIL